MSDSQAPDSEALVPKAPAAMGRPSDLLMSDDEIRRMFRIAESLAMSGMWKDITKAEKAMAKMVIGRDLGLTPAQSMQGIHIVDGGVQMHYTTLGQFIRARPGYDYRAAWIKGDATNPVLVWHDEEDPLDNRPIFGCSTVFYVDGKQRGISRYTVEDAQKAGLIKDDKRAAWNTSLRNMLFARSISNGSKWFVPEVFGGMPVYVSGELDARSSLTEGSGSGDDEGQGIDLGPRVEKVIERAKKIGHRGLANRAAVEAAVGRRAPSAVKQWVEDANAVLDRMVAEQAAADPPDAEVVDASAAEVPTGPSSPVSPDPDRIVSTVPVDETAVAVLRTRLERLNAIDPVSMEENDASQLEAEIAYVEGQLRDMGVSS